MAKLATNMLRTDNAKHFTKYDKYTQNLKKCSIAISFSLLLITADCWGSVHVNWISIS